MKFRYLFLCLISSPLLADPFYGDEQAVQIPQNSAKNNEQNFAENSHFLTACEPSENLNPIHLGIEFSKLKLVGLIGFDTDFRALFIDDHNRIIDLKTADLLEPDKIEITEIDLKTVRYIAWQNVQNCDSPTISTLKF